MDILENQEAVEAHIEDNILISIKSEQAHYARLGLRGRLSSNGSLAGAAVSGLL